MTDPILSIALMLACEANHSTDIERLVVVQVVLNRAQADDMYLHDVLLEPRQFCLRDMRKDDPRLLPHLQFVRQVLQYQPPDMTGGALYFTTTDKSPKTLKPLELTVRWGDFRLWRERI